MPPYLSSDSELENALALIQKQSGRTRPQLLRDWILQELHLTRFFEGEKIGENNPNVLPPHRSNLV